MNIVEELGDNVKNLIYDGIATVCLVVILGSIGIYKITKNEYRKNKEQKER